MTSASVAPAPPTNVEAPFYPVATHKFIVMSICTFGLYELYWAYKCWRRIESRSSQKLQPFWRAFFGHLYAFSLFTKIREYAKQNRVAVGWNASLLASLYFLLAITYRLPGVAGLVCFLGFLPALPVLFTVQAIRRSGKFRERLNDHYGVAHIIVIILGASWLGFVIFARVALTPR